MPAEYEHSLGRGVSSSRANLRHDKRQPLVFTGRQLGRRSCPSYDSASGFGHGFAVAAVVGPYGRKPEGHWVMGRAGIPMGM